MAEDGAAIFAAISMMLLSMATLSAAYRPGDIVPLSRMGQYHSSRTVWHDIVGRHCPIFAVNRERYSGGDLLGITAKVVDMPHHYVEIHPDIRKQFWDPQHWPKHVLVRYTWEEHSEIDVSSGFFVLFGSGLMLSVVLSIYILQSSKEKIARFVRETVADNNMAGGVEKVE
uniref:Uncharacterized protein n=1 Tax=Chenopodium quinoa TaxID=63459 RepID=A0A803L3D3_CHEQI